MQGKAACGIYQWRNVVNGKVYLGSSQDCSRRMLEHRSSLRRGAHVNKKLQAAWNKYGEANFEFSMLFTVFDRDHLEAVEQDFLDDRRATVTGYNLAPTAGNTAGWRASEETRQRMSAAAKKRDNTAQVLSMAQACRGKKRPQYVIDAMQAGRRAAPLTDQSRQRMSESAKARGSSITPEHKARLIQMTKARARFTAEQQGQMAAMRADGSTLREIGLAFGIAAESSVHMNIKRWRDQQAAA